MNDKLLKIVLFEDDPEYRVELPKLFADRLGHKGTVVLFDSPSEVSEHELYEERLARELAASKYNDPTLIVADRDLSRTASYGGMSEAVVKKVADVLCVPECAYARGEKADEFLKDAEQREARVALSLSDGNEAFVERVIQIAEGFALIQSRLPDSLEASRKNSPGKLLAQVLQKPEYSDKISLYASGDQNRLVTVLRVQGDDPSRKSRLACLLGYWLWDSVLRFPGIVVNSTAASSYLNIEAQAFQDDPEIRALFEPAIYDGPFAKAKDCLWWRGMVDDIVTQSGFEDGRSMVESKLGRSIPRSICCEDSNIPAGYYCMLSKQAVSLKNSKAGLAWFPRGADLARVSNHEYAESVPWL